MPTPIYADGWHEAHCQYIENYQWPCDCDQQAAWGEAADSDEDMSAEAQREARLFGP